MFHILLLLGSATMEGKSEEKINHGGETERRLQCAATLPHPNRKKKEKEDRQEKGAMKKK